MNEAIVTALITGSLTLAGVFVSAAAQASRIDHKLDRKLAVTETRLEELTREVREHNGFARRMPVLEEQVRALQSRADGAAKRKR